MGALALAPLSIVQAVLSGGLVFLAVLAERYFGFQLGRWQWIGVTITAAGLAVIGLTGGGAARPQESSLAALIAGAALMPTQHGEQREPGEESTQPTNSTAPTR